jgi:tight adherence protein B
MEFGDDVRNLAFTFMVAIAVGGVALAVLFPMLNGSEAAKRVDQISTGKKETKTSFRSRLADDGKDTRRKQIQESLKQIEDQEKQRKRKLTLRAMIAQAGLEISPRGFWMMSLVSCVLFGVIPMFLGAPWFVSGVQAPPPHEQVLE